MSPTIIILTGNCALYIIYMYVEVRHGIYMCSKIWKIENMHRPNSLALQAGKKLYLCNSLRGFVKKTAIQQWPFVTKIWVLLKRTSVKYWLYYCYIYIYAKSTKYYIIHITILLYYSSYYTILYKYYFITKYHIYIHIIIHISYPADRNCAPKRRNNAYFGVIRSCLICVDSASNDFGPF